VYLVGGQQSHCPGGLPNTPKWSIPAEVADAKPAKTQVAWVHGVIHHCISHHSAMSVGRLPAQCRSRIDAHDSGAGVSPACRESERRERRLGPSFRQLSRD
jgi:hypothetical protein